MANIGSVEIKVTPSELRNKAASLRNEVLGMQRVYSNLETKLNATSYYWIGEAGDLHRKLYQEQKKDLEALIVSLLEHAKDLEDIANEYEGVEVDVEAIVETLATDALS